MKKIKVKKNKAVEDYNEYKKWTKETFQKIIQSMFIDFITFDIEFNNDEKEDQKRMQAVYLISYDNNYHKALITAFPVAYKLYNTNKNKLIDAMIHEMCHIHVGSLASVAQKRYIIESDLIDTCENLTEVMAMYVRVFIKGTTKNIYS